MEQNMYSKILEVSRESSNIIHWKGQKGVLDERQPIINRCGRSFWRLSAWFRLKLPSYLQEKANKSSETWRNAEEQLRHSLRVQRFWDLNLLFHPNLLNVQSELVSRRLKHGDDATQTAAMATARWINSNFSDKLRKQRQINRLNPSRVLCLLMVFPSCSDPLWQNLDSLFPGQNLPLPCLCPTSKKMIIN